MFLEFKISNFCILGFLMLLVFVAFDIEAAPSRRDVVLKEVFDQVILKMKSKYKAQCFCSGGAMMTDIKRLELSFYIQDSVNVDEAREIMVYFAESFLSTVNQNEKIRSYLENYPFGPQNLGLMVAFVNEDGTDTFDPNLSSVILARSKVFYLANNFENPYESIDVLEESYDQAVSKVSKGE